MTEASIYWNDDTGQCDCHGPALWRLLYKTADGWSPVDARSSYGVIKDSANRVSFAPVTTSGLRVEITLQPQFSAGILEWSVDAPR